MVNVRFFVYVFVVMIIATCTYARARHWDNYNNYEKRLFGCSELGGSCSDGVFSKSCCDGNKCHSTTKKCVRPNSSGSWLADRNGK